MCEGVEAVLRSANCKGGTTRQQRGVKAFDERRAVSVGLACPVSCTAIEIHSTCAVSLVWMVRPCYHFAGPLTLLLPPQSHFVGFGSERRPARGAWL